MSMSHLWTEIIEKKNRTLLSKKEEKLLILETLHTLRLMTEFFCNEVDDFVIPMSLSEHLEWDSRVKRFVYHKGEFSQYLELARKETLFRIQPYLMDLLRIARENLK